MCVSANAFLRWSVRLLLLQTAWTSGVIGAYVDDFAVGACDASCQADQRLALQSIYNSLKGPSWLLQSGWASSATSANATSMDYCSWDGIICCPSNMIYYNRGFSTACYTSDAVVALFLPFNGLEGSFPAAAKATLFKTLEHFNAAGMAVS